MSRTTTATATPPPSSPRSSPAKTVIAGLVALALLAVFFLLVPVEAEPWVKSLHIVALIAWMAGMLYLPRLFVYHAEAGPGSPQAETFKIMERRLLKAIMTPAMLVTWAAGLWLALRVGWLFQPGNGWLHVKILLVLIMSGIHGYLAGSTKRFARDVDLKTARHWRIVNEIPTVLLILIVILVVVKPF